MRTPPLVALCFAVVCQTARACADDAGLVACLVVRRLALHWTQLELDGPPQPAIQHRILCSFPNLTDMFQLHCGVQDVCEAGRFDQKAKTMITKRILTTAAALGTLAASLAGATTAASAAGVGVYFDIPGLYGSPPPRDRDCWKWSHAHHAWEWRCSKPHPDVTWDHDHRNWNGY